MSASQNCKRSKQKRPRPQWSDSNSLQMVLLACSIFTIAEGKTYYVRRSAFKIPSFSSERNDNDVDDTNDDDDDDDGRFKFISAHRHGISTSGAPKRIGNSRSLQESLGVPTESPQPSPSPSQSPSSPPMDSVPTPPPTSRPSETLQPSPSPSVSPSITVTPIPTMDPTRQPSQSPIEISTQAPSVLVTIEPTQNPVSPSPSSSPTLAPTTAEPSFFPTTNVPSLFPTTNVPSLFPTTNVPSLFPTTNVPSLFPTTNVPSLFPTTNVPSLLQTTNQPSLFPSTNQPSSMLITWAPILPTTHEPSRAPSRTPIFVTMSPTLEATVIKTSTPTDLPTQTSTSENPTSVPSVSIPITSVPKSETPTASPYVIPSKSSPPQVSHITPSIRPTISPSTEATTMPVRQTIDITPITPVGVTLNFDTPLSNTEIEQVTKELQVSVEEFLNEKLRDTAFGEGVTLLGFDLIVTRPNLTARRAHLLLRSLQSAQELMFSIDGKAEFDTVDENIVDTIALGNRVDESVIQSLDSSESGAQFIEYVKTTDTEVLSVTSGATFQTQKRDDSNSRQRPTIGKIVVGFVVVGLGALGLMGYCFIWLKGRRKRASQRKRDREGISATLSKPMAPETRKAHNISQHPPPTTLQSTTQVTRRDEESSESSSYQGVDSESDGSNDVFAKELKSAAKLDKQAWDDYQNHKSTIEKDGTVIRRQENGITEDPYTGAAAAGLAGGAIGRALYTARSDDGDEGMEIFGNDSQSQLIIRPTGDMYDFEPYGDSTVSELITSSSYSYGDEFTHSRLPASRQDPPAPTGSTAVVDDRHIDPVGHRGSYLGSAYQTEQGVEWTPTGIATVLEQSESAEDWSGEHGLHEITSYGDRGYGKLWGTVDKDGESDDDAAIALVDALTAGTSMATLNKKNMSPNKAAVSSFDEYLADDADTANRSPGNICDTPNSHFLHSAPSAQTVRITPESTRPSPNHIETTAQASSKIAVGEESLEDQQQSKGSSLLTIDIVKEVEMLSRFVRRYEQKREKGKEKEGRTKDPKVTTESRSIPGVGYDALSDSASAMKATSPVELSGSRDDPSYLSGSYALSQLDLTPIETEPSETDESSQYSWSTHSELDGRFERINGDDDESLLDEEDKLNDFDGSGPFEGIDLCDSDDKEDESFDLSEQGSDDSRLGITPFNVQQLMAEHKNAMGSLPFPSKVEQVSRSVENLRVSRPPLTGNPLTSTHLSPIPGTPRTPGSHEERNLVSKGSPLADLTRNINAYDIESPPMKKLKSPDKSPVSNSSGLNALQYQESGQSHNDKVNEYQQERRQDEAQKQADKIVWKAGSLQRSVSEKKTLSQLRLRDAILDEAEMEVIAGIAQEYEDSLNPSASPQGSGHPQTSPSVIVQDEAYSPSLKVNSRKSRNQGFSSLLSMFENKPKEAIFPPNENWQYNSTRKRK